MKILQLLRILAFKNSSDYKKLSKVILDGEARTDISEMMKECDSVFIDRLHKNPYWLSMQAWQTHFEWQDLKNDFPEIKGHILDFGCGSGQSDLLLGRVGYKIHGIDLSPIGIDIANYFREKEDTNTQSNVSFELRDITTPNNSGVLYDACWSSHVFEHIEHPGPILKGICQYLKKDAVILISVPYKHAYDDPGHVNHFNTPEELKKWLAPHITVKEVRLNETNNVLRAICLNN